jgi:hypothetical protein
MVETMWTCCDQEIYDNAGILAHLESVHGLTPPIQAISGLVQALDGVGWTMNTFEVRIGDLLLHKSVKTTKEPTP